jgi:uncharacterized protein with HEPN domain/predicted RNase H-like HicB family nuclease
MTTKQAPRKKKLRTAGFSNPNALKLDIPTPPTLRVCLARGLFGSGISPRGHREMTVAHSKRLIERYPGLYRLADATPVPSSPPFAREGFACGDGWFTLIDRLSAKLSADPDLVVGQLKEKLGLLRVYFEPSPLPPDDIEEATDAALVEAVAESRITCERCGKPGKHAQRGGRWSAKCDACAAKEARRRREFLSPWMERHLALREKSVFERNRLLAASGERSPIDLTPEHALALLEKYPVLYREAWAAPTSPKSPFAAGGFEIGDGWFALVDRLSEKLAKDTALYVVQIKEKYGRLKVYFNRDENVPQDPSLDDELEAALVKAADESERTCEVCGKPGTIDERHRWVSVRCEPCLQAEEEERKKVESKKPAAKDPHKFWLDDLALTPKPASEWFKDIQIACERLPMCLGFLDFARFSASRTHQDAVVRHIYQIAVAASHQPSRIRLRHPAVDWKALVRLKKRTTYPFSPPMSPKEIWDFIHKEVPEMEKGLRRRWTKAEREAAEARADARDVRMADKICADLDAGRVRAISSEEMRKRLGLGPIGNKPQTPYSHRYHFVFWLEDEIWSAKAPTVRGVYGVGPTAEKAKDSLVEALKLMSESEGEGRKAAVCNRLVAAWKTGKTKKT